MLDIDLMIESGGLYMTTLPGGASFTWRLLTLKEYKVFRGLRESGALHPYSVHMKVFDRCYTGISDLVDPMLPAGLFISIGQLIMWWSGDCAGETQKDDILAARAAYPADSVHEHMKRVIFLAFPSYTLEDVELWTRPELLRKFTISESVLVNRGIGYEPLKPNHILSPQQAQQKQSINYKKENADMRRAMGGRGPDDTHPLEMHPAEFEKRQRIAAAMERRKRGGSPRRR